jgi:hypothetical protein
MPGHCAPVNPAVQLGHAKHYEVPTLAPMSVNGATQLVTESFRRDHWYTDCKAFMRWSEWVALDRQVV